MQRRNFLKLIGVTAIVPHLPVESTYIPAYNHHILYGSTCAGKSILTLSPGKYNMLMTDISVSDMYIKIGMKLHNVITLTTIGLTGSVVA